MESEKKELPRIPTLHWGANNLGEALRPSTRPGRVSVVRTRFRIYLRSIYVESEKKELPRIPTLHWCANTLGEALRPSTRPGRVSVVRARFRIYSSVSLRGEREKGATNAEIKAGFWRRTGDALFKTTFNCCFHRFLRNLTVERIE